MEQENVAKISQAEIHKFIEGHDPEERIVNLSYNSEDNFITIHYRDKNDVKRTRQQPFYPFCWATLKACKRLCGGNRQELLFLMEKYGIGCKKLSQTSITGEVRSEFDDGYLFMFYAKRPISYRLFSAFFKKARNPLYPKKDDSVKVPKEIEKQYLVASPQEQFLISTGKRFFKGYDDYDQILRMIFDIESTGLDTKKDRINQIGIRTNRPSPGFPNGLEIILTSDGGETEEEKDASELWIINEFLKYISLVNPDVITAHNGEAFDWNIILGACERMGVSIEKLCEPHFGVGKYIYKSTKNTILKLGGEIETYNETIVPNIIVTDSLHAVRRAQALDSNMLRADLKYVTEYSKMKKENRVYVPGGKISETWNDTAYQYALNNKNGDWYKYDPTMGDKDDGEDFVGKKSFIPVHGFLREGYELKSGKYIVERYLLDDLYECDKVEHRYNITNFLICKLIPVPYKKCTTMGTAGQWKSLMLAWSYEHNLAIPMFAERKSFTGGLSRLLTTGYVENVIKLDYNSLYPSIILTWGISAGIDLMGATLSFLEHILTQREEFKIAKKKAGKLKEKYKAQIEAGTATKAEMEELQRLKDKAANEEAFNDKKQLPFKIFGNSFFGSYGAPNVFPWGSIKCAEQITCTGRQSLRLMISHFRNLGYLPIVGDSFTEDTPVFVKYNKSGNIDIRPISELINEDKIEIDAIGREYDYSKKPYKVLCRSGWIEPSYIYRHKTDKDIYEISDGDMTVEVTEDHSLFDCNRNKIKPSEIVEDTELEYFDNLEAFNEPRELTLDARNPQYYAKKLADGEIDRVPMWFLNRPEFAKEFYDIFIANYHSSIKYSKTCLAGLLHLKRIMQK